MRKLIMTLVLALGLGATTANAGPTGRVAAGNTGVALSDGFTGALDSLGVELDLIGPTRIRRGLVRFPIPAGALDLDTLAGDIFHRGGITLSAGGTTVALFHFIIDTTAEPVLTGLVTVNGDVVGRVPLFDLTLTEGPTVGRFNIVRLDGVELTLNIAAADALNAIFNVDAFAEGFGIGTARVRTLLVDVIGAETGGSDHDDDDDDDDDDD